MTRLDSYRSAVLATSPVASDAYIEDELADGSAEFVSFVIAHGLGPLWHERTGRDEFHACRLSAEANYVAQEHALHEIDEILGRAGIDYAVIKGSANRLLLYENPAIRTSYDIDLLVRPEDRVQTASALVDCGFTANPTEVGISRELVLTRVAIDIDLHWQLLREGRLRTEIEIGMLERRRRLHDVWMLNAEDAFFLLLVHPAFAKHLAGWEMGLHRVVDILNWIRVEAFDWQAVRASLKLNGVQTAAWATLRWVQLLTHPDAPEGLDAMLADTRPGRLRRAWLDFWLRSDLSRRMSRLHLIRLLGFSLFLHDTPRDAVRAIAGRYRSHRRSSADIEAFRNLPG